MNFLWDFSLKEKQNILSLFMLETSEERLASCVSTLFVSPSSTRISVTEKKQACKPSSLVIERIAS